MCNIDKQRVKVYVNNRPSNMHTQKYCQCCFFFLGGGGGSEVCIIAVFDITIVVV